MSITPIVTYNEILSIVINWITSNCQNLRSDWGTSSASLRYINGTIHNVGVSQTRWLDHVGDNNSGTTYRDRSNATARLTISGGVGAVSSATVNTDITNFFSALGLTTEKINYPVDDKNIYPFLRNIVYFCSRKVCWAISCLPTTSANIMGISGNGNNQTSSVVQSNMTKVLVYNSAEITGGTPMDPQLSSAPNTEVYNSDNVVVGSTRKHTLKASDMSGMVTEILNNRLNYKIIGATCTGSIV